jgi:hypothetical protein
LLTWSNNRKFSPLLHLPRAWAESQH